jgi:prophage antirepressor-like protein
VRLELDRRRLHAVRESEALCRGRGGDHRHEWYAFRGRRVRVFLDADRRPWFALGEIAFILSIEADDKAFRNYGPQELGIPESASEKCLSESGLRRLIKYSPHPDAGALGLWLDREVLLVLSKKRD